MSTAEQTPDSVVSDSVSTDGADTDTDTAADVRLVDVTKRFGGFGGGVVAVDDLSLHIPQGSFFALLGPSGCGKTTTLRMIGGLEDPTSGRIYLGDNDVTGMKPYRRPVNTVFQNYALFPHLDLFENVAFGLRRKGAKGDDLTRQVERMLELVELGGMGRRKPSQLSGGQQQRVALARALINHPRVLLLDEPLGALDMKLRKQMQLELKRIQTEVGLTFIHVTHDQEEAMTMADTIAVMNHGKVEQLGSPVELYERPRTEFVANFLGQSNLLPATVAGRDGDLAIVDVHGTQVRVPADRVAGGSLGAGGSSTSSGALRIGVRPEKIGLLPADTAGERGGRNQLEGTITDSSFIGVSTQFLVRTPWGEQLTVVAQNVASPDAAAGGRGLSRGLDRGAPVVMRWAPWQTFVIDGTV